MGNKARVYSRCAYDRKLQQVCTVYIQKAAAGVYYLFIDESYLQLKVVMSQSHAWGILKFTSARLNVCGVMEYPLVSCYKFNKHFKKQYKMQHSHQHLIPGRWTTTLVKITYNPKLKADWNGPCMTSLRSDTTQSSTAGFQFLQITDISHTWYKPEHSAYAW